MNAILRYSPLLLLLLAWEAITRFGLVSRQILPDLATIGAAWLQLIAGGELAWHLAMSMARAFGGLALAIVIGVPAGLIMAVSKPFRLALNPLVQMIYPIPKSALVPLMMIWLGLGSSSKVVLIFIGCLLPVIVSAYNGAKSVNPFLLWSAASLGASRRQSLVEVLLPAAMPSVLTGIRTALGFAFILMVTSEFVIAKDGIGYLIAFLGDGGVYPSMFAAIFTVAAIGFFVDRAYSMLSGRLLRWTVT
jgi:ABC-type nitrate/sulfonate/bicarbonate transport system permease component